MSVSKEKCIKLTIHLNLFFNSYDSQNVCIKKIIYILFIWSTLHTINVKYNKETLVEKRPLVPVCNAH
jgi:hypothetical protein